MKKRIPGFDLARAYAIFGMYIVNFNIVFGQFKDKSWVGQFLTLFNGNSSTLFVILAGMGLALMSKRSDYAPTEKKQLRTIVTRRSWFLFFLGLLLFMWWPADILHFYGAYMHLAAWMLFLNRKLYLYAALMAIAGFHLLLLLIPFETGWDFDTLAYKDFWTFNGFIRNTFYNGWNSVFPWTAFFFFGMWLGRLNWYQPGIKRKLLLYGLVLFACVQLLQGLAAGGYFNEGLSFYLTADYLPPFLPFMLGTASISLVILVFCVQLGNNAENNRLISALGKTGQMTLTHYLSHLTIGILLFSILSGKSPELALETGKGLAPLWILLYSIFYFVLSVYFSIVWTRYFKNGPFETLMRKIAG